MVKAGNRYRFARAWMSCAAILLGVLAGYFVGRASILYATRSRMADYANRLLQHDEEIAVEIKTTLAQANASPDPPCSEADIVLLRRLTFSARFLKDVGRLHKGSFLCSAIAGKLQVGIPLQAPDLSLHSGISVYRNYPLSVPAGDRAEIAVLRDSDTVISPDIFSEYSQQPIHFLAGVLDRAHGVILTRLRGPVPIPHGVSASRGVTRVGDTLYLARCSRTYAVCVMTYISLPEVWLHYRALLYVYVATGTAAGLACAVALLMTGGHKRRSHTNQLKHAILMGKLSVVYQPIVELGSLRIVGAEALARWTDEAGESIRPETIIALAEAEGFVSEITRFVLTRAIEELKTILEGNPEFHLHINLALSDLADPRLLMLLDENLRESLIVAQNLTFELTERATSDRELAGAAIRRLRERGHAVFIDDFGTGYSNLAYLTELNVDGIKINRSFIATLGTESVTASIVPQILGMARALSLKVVVQGIERKEQAMYFAAQDPLILGQGWFFGLPIPARSLMYLCAEKTE
jgi:sensor c-di-GMP phosphodiesterase-like protein